MTIAFIIFMIILAGAVLVEGMVHDTHTAQRSTVIDKNKYVAEYTPPKRKPTRKSTKLEILEYNLQNENYRSQLSMLGYGMFGAGLIWALAHRHTDNQVLAADIAEQLPNFYNEISFTNQSPQFETLPQSYNDSVISNDVTILEPDHPVDNVFNIDNQDFSDPIDSDNSEPDHDIIDINGNDYDIDNTIDYDYGQVIDAPDNVEFQPIDVQPDMDFFPFT